VLVVASARRNHPCCRGLRVLRDVDQCLGERFRAARLEVLDLVGLEVGLDGRKICRDGRDPEDDVLEQLR
jgi:hypothetical protein